MKKEFLTKLHPKGVILFIAGWLLSPLTWWNDVFLNLPIAYFTGSIVDKILPGSFIISVIIAYWATNMLGFILMYYGGKEAIGKHISKIDWYISLTIGGVYTIIMVIFINKGWVKPLYGWLK